MEEETGTDYRSERPEAEVIEPEVPVLEEERSTDFGSTRPEVEEETFEVPDLEQETSQDYGSSSDRPEVTEREAAPEYEIPDLEQETGTDYGSAVADETVESEPEIVDLPNVGDNSWLIYNRDWDDGEFQRVYMWFGNEVYEEATSYYSGV